MRRILKNLTLVIALLLCSVGLIGVGISKTTNNHNVQTIYAADEHNHENMIAWESATSLPTSGSYYLTSDVRVSTTCTVSGTLNLCLNGHGIIFTGTTIGSGTVFNIQPGKTLNLYDCGETEHKYRITPADIGTTFSKYIEESPAGLAKVDDTLTENYQTFTGGYITGGIGMTRNNSYYNGGAFFILGGTLNMYGGNIIGNTVKNPSSDGNNGGALYVAGGTFIMNGGAIIGNTVDVSNKKSFDMAGAIYCSVEKVNGYNASAYVTINGGVIKQNHAIGGGAFFVGSDSGDKKAYLTVNNATITENVAYGYVYSSPSGDGGVLNAQGGQITFNNCEISGNIGYQGGAFRLYESVYSTNIDSNKLIIKDSNITNNFSYYYGTVYINAEVTSYGKVKCLDVDISNTHIDNNTSLSSSATLSVNGCSQISTIKSLEMTISNSTINNNIKYYDSCVGMGIYCSNSSYSNGPEVTMTDCEITGNIINYSNTQSNYTAGLEYSPKTVLNISGKIVVANNKYHNTNNDTYQDSNLYFSSKNNSTINIVGELDGNSLIGVRKYIDPYYVNPKTYFGTGPVTSGLTNNGSVNSFFSDKENFYIVEENGEAVLKEKFSITYNKNTAKTGTVPATAYFIPNETATIADNVGELAKSGHRFVGWNTLADGTGTMYQPDDTFEISENITLYAIFEHTSHDDIDFVQWTDALAEEQNGSGKTATNSLPSVAGDYYFTANITISNIWTAPSGTTNICLNGCTITTTASSAVYVPTNATLNIYDEDENYGKITGGKGGYDGKRGGGMYVMGTVNIYGGSITGNEAAYGGGVYIKDGSFTMYKNARITSNKSKTSYDTWANGGGFLIDNGTLTIYGGYISSNSADREDAAIALASGNLYLYGGTITYNTSGLSGSGSVRNYGSGNIYVSGNPYVMNNNTVVNSTTTRNDVYLVNGKKLIVDGELNQNAKIGVTVQNTGVFTQGLLGNGAETNFYSDNTSYGVGIDENGEVELYPSNAVAVINKTDGHTYHTSFADAINNWTDGTTLKLLADVSGTQITVSSGTKTLDLNNHIVTYTSGSVIIVSGGTLNIKDDSANKTKHYYNINTTGVATISSSATNYYFEGGYITGGVATAERGGGLRVTGGEVNFAGGTIFACRAGWGGGIWTSGTSSVTISDSAAIIGCYSSGAYTSGGGIFCEGSGAITMTSGSIRHNSSQFSGAGVRVSLQETTGTYFTMTGGEITGNYSGSHQGSGLALDMANRIKIGGSARIYGNDGDDLFLKNGGYVTVVEPFTEDALIYVKTQTLPTETNSIVITDGWTTVMEDADFKNIFIYYNENYRIKKNKSCELVASVLHVHNWVYTANGNVITATCETDEDCTMNSQTITLNVDGKVYDGTAVVATITKSDGWLTSNALVEIGNIEYTGNTNAGTYTASITAGGVTATKQFTITPLAVTVTITGHNNTTNYDGNAHSISGYDAQANSALYSVAQDFVLNGLANAERTNAGTTAMGLEATMFENINENFANVTFVVVDGYQTILTVDAVITTQPQSREVSFNKFEQDLVVTGEVVGGAIHYAVVTDANQTPGDEDYDVTIPKAIDAGNYYVWYKIVADENHNDLESVRLISIINTVDAVITKNPVKIDNVYDETAQEIVAAGEVDGGTIHYAIVTDANQIPNKDSYNAAIPTASNVGYYYIWYKVVADKNHNDLEPVRLTAIVYEEDWLVLNGVVYQSDMETVVSNALVTLTKGNQIVVSTLTNTDGEYQFIIPAGVYNIVTEFGTNIETTLTKVFENKEQDVSMNGGITESILEVNSNDNYADISVGGLNEEAYSIRETESIPNEQSVSVMMTVEPKAQDVIANAEKIVASAKNKSLEFLEIKVKKTVDNVTTIIDETNNILEIVVPYEKINRHDLIVYSYHDQAVRTFTEIQLNDEIVDGSFRLDKENKYIYIYTKCFSIFAIGYTPHYKVDTTLSLGSFVGTVNITLVSQDDQTTYNLLDVEVGKLTFDDIPMGEYVMTITWEDCVTNTLTMPIRISGKTSTIVDAEPNIDENNAQNEATLVEDKNSFVEINETVFEEQDKEVENIDCDEVQNINENTDVNISEKNGQYVILENQTQSNQTAEAQMVSVQKQYFKKEDIDIANGYADEFGNLVKNDVDYKLKKQKEN